MRVCCPTGLKIGKFSVSEACDPDALDRQQREADLVPLRAAVEAFMPHAAGPVLDFAACMFIMTPDGHFVIDSHPKHEQVSVTRYICKVHLYGCWGWL